MISLPDPRLDYKPSSQLLFRHGNLLEELRVIRRHHASPLNQIIHLFSIVVAFACVASTFFLIGEITMFPRPIVIFLVILFFPLPYLGFYSYLDLVISIFWMPLFAGAVFGGFIIAEFLPDIMPHYAAIPLTVVFALLALVPQLFGHLLLEKERSPLFEVFQFAIMTAFFLGYCAVGWISCGHIRRVTIDKIWSDEVDRKTPSGDFIF